MLFDVLRDSIQGIFNTVQKTINQSINQSIDRSTSGRMYVPAIVNCRDQQRSTHAQAQPLKRCGRRQASYARKIETKHTHWRNEALDFFAVDERRNAIVKEKIGFARRVVVNLVDEQHDRLQLKTFVSI